MPGGRRSTTRPAIISAECTRAIGWALPILRALQDCPSLAAKHSQWRTLDLSDLAFAIETRVRALAELPEEIDVSLRLLVGEFEADCRRDKFIERGRVPPGVAYPFENLTAVRRVRTGAVSFIVECQSLLENLVRFDQRFHRYYLKQQMSKNQSRKRLVQFSGDASISQQIETWRNDLLHFRAPFLEFEVNESEPRYRARLCLDWRPGSRDCMMLEQLLTMQSTLLKAAVQLQQDLTAKVRRLCR